MLAECLIIELTVTILGVAAVACLLGAVAKSGWQALVWLSSGLFAALLAVAGCLSAVWVEGLDTTVSHLFATPRTHRSFMLADSTFRYIGDPTDVAIVAAICGALLSWWRRSAVPLLLVMGGVVVSVTVEHVLKALVGRTIHLDELGTRSSVLLGYLNTYPSGHVAGSAALLGMIAVVVGTGRRRVIRAALGAAVIACVLSVAFMALYVHAHLLSDVIGGMFLGGAIVSLGAAISRATLAPVQVQLVSEQV